MLKKKCDNNIARTIALAQEMIELAQEGYEHQEDPGCGVLYGILLDSGYRILDLAKKEKDAHVQKGWWDNTVNKETI
ncbi:MAG TPA: hypothetical protein DHV36_06300 [Desulfobacteraceae bacterium]|nr:hypothetical protein [Desulfobacteraceae bacterium]|tara:strand:- start:240 stop:470 length:231 start_codon:yes stop_codon:yes gene_type:complete